MNARFNFNDFLNAKKIMSCKINLFWLYENAWMMAFYGNPECDSQELERIYKINNVSAAAYPGLLYMVLNESLDTGPFDPLTDMQIMLFAYSKILMQSL